MVQVVQERNSSELIYSLAQVRRSNKMKIHSILEKKKERIKIL